MTAAAASRLLESVARDRGLWVDRLAPDLVVCDDDRHRVLFRGLAGARSGRVTEELCGNDAWLRAHLARSGLPVVPTRLVDLADAGPVRLVTEELGFPVRLRPATARDGSTATGVDSLLARWRALRESAAIPGGQLILEPFAAGRPADVAVVGGRAVAESRSGDIPAPVAAELAVRAIDALPGTDYGSVRVVPVGPEVAIETVDPCFRRWVAADGVTGLELTRAIIDLEFDPART